jgi:hypothetical protein
MSGWKSRYDYQGMNNLEKLTGRKLHTQDNCWSIAKALYVALAVLIAYIALSGGINLRDFIAFFSYLR